MKISYGLPIIKPIEDVIDAVYREVHQHQVQEIERAWRDRIVQNIIRDTGVDPSLAHVIIDSMFRTFSENIAVLPPTNLRSGEE